MTNPEELQDPAFVRSLRAFEGVLNRAILPIVVALIIASTALALAGVVLRYGFGVSYVLIEEICRYCIVYAVLLYFGPLVTRDAHLSMSILPDVISVRGRRILDTVTYVVLSGLLAVLTVAAIQWEQGLYNMGLLTMSGELRAYIPSAALPIGIGLACFYTVLRTVYSAFGASPNTLVDMHGGHGTDEGTVKVSEEGS